MKTLTQSHLRVIMWNKVMNLSQESNFSARKIAHLLGLDPRTVRSYQSMSEKEFYCSVNEGIRKYVCRLDAYYDFVKKLLNSDSELTAAAIEDRLKENFEDLPVVSSKTFYNFVGYVRKSECIPKHVNMKCPSNFTHPFPTFYNVSACWSVLLMAWPHYQAFM